MRPTDTGTARKSDGAFEAAMSVVVVGRDGYDTLRPILTCLSEQTRAAALQIIALLPQDEEVDLGNDVLSEFGSFCPVVIGPIGNRGVAAAKALPHVSAPIVAFTENHCFPDPTWAEQLIEAHKTHGCAGVAPAVLNANPEGELSWSAYATGYAQFDVHYDARFIDEMPLHNTSYKTEELQRRANRLEVLLADERRLQAEIRRDGGKFFFDPAIQTRHINEGTLSLGVRLNLINGRRYGTMRSKHMNIARRALYGLGFVALSGPIYLNNLRRLEGVTAPGRRSLRFHLSLWFMSLAHALGEAAAYIGFGREEFEFLEIEEFMLLERLGRHPLNDPRIARFAALAREVPGA